MVPRPAFTCEPNTGRRREARLRVRLAAQLIAHDGTFTAVLCDLSLGGARLSGPKINLRPGNEALLKWDRFEAFGVVRWALGGTCGLLFYDPVERKELLETRTLDTYARLPPDRELVREAARKFVGVARKI